MLFSNQDVNDQEALIIAHAMTKISTCDGVDAREKALISDFLSTIAGAPSFDDLAKSNFDIASAKKDLSANGAIMMIEGCWLVALADRAVSAVEKDLIKSFADGLGVNNVNEIRDEVIEEFIANFSTLKNVDAITELKEQLKA